MKSNEAIIKIIGKLNLEYGDSLDQQKVRHILEEALYDYDVTDKETSLTILDDMNDKIYIYISSKKIDGLSNLTLQNYTRRLSKFSDYMRKNVADITTMDIRRYLAIRSNEGLKNSTIATETDILRGFFGWLEDEEYITKSPMKKIKTIKTEKRVRKALTKRELEILRQGAITLREQGLLEFLYSTGARLDEAMKVNKDDIDWQNLSLRVIGKGNKERIVYLNAKALVHIKNYLKSRHDNSSALFVTERKPHTRLGRRGIEREINKIQIQSDLEKNVYPHLLRHSAASHWLNSGMDITVVKEILGHQDLSTTEIYAKISNQEVEHSFKKYS